MRRLLVWLLLLAFSLLPAAANAAHWEVYYDSATTPSFAGTQAQIEADIQTVLRQWEHYSQGSANFRWMGSEPNVACASGRMVLRYGTLGAQQCAYNDPWTLIFQSCASITFSNSTGVDMRAARHPSDLVGAAASRCRSLQSLLHHEIAHGYHNWPNAHEFDAVRSGCSLDPFECGSDFLSRHLWNRDMHFVDRVFFPLRTAGIRFGSFLESHLLESNVQTMTPEGLVHPSPAIAPGHINPTWEDPTQYEPLAIAWSTHSFDSFFGPPTSLHFELPHDPWESPHTVDFFETENSAYKNFHPLCLASNHLGTFVLAWASGSEAPVTFLSNGYTADTSGARAVWFVRSTDEGRSWSAPAQIGSATTRAGIACSYDPPQQRFVLLYTGAGDEGLWLTQAHVSSSSWSFPVQLGIAPGRSVVPTTVDTPNIDFAYETADNPGRISWIDNIDGPSIASIVWNGTGYGWNSESAVASMGSPNPRLLRSRVAIYGASGGLHVAYGVNSSDTLQRHHLARVAPAPAADLYDSDTSTSFRWRYWQFANATSPYGISPMLLSITWSGAE